jgi:hypothetical protein
MGIFDRFRKPKNAQEDIALCLTNTARRITDAGAEGVLTAPMHLMSMVSALSQVHQLSPEPGSIVSGALLPVRKEGADKPAELIKGSQRLREHLMCAAGTEYALGFAMLAAYSHSTAALVSRAQCSSAKTWRDLAKDMQAAGRLLS